MRLGRSTKGQNIYYYVQKTGYVKGKNKSIIVEWFGSEKEICKKYGVSDAKAWALERIRIMNEAAANGSEKFNFSLSTSEDLPLNDQRRYNGGYLFLQQIYYDLGLDRICTEIRRRHRFNFNINSILSRLLYTRILFPSSKSSSFEESKRFLEQPDFEQHQVYRALSVLAEESDYVQSRLFKNSLDLAKRNTEVIYYDCTNFYFEIEQPDGDRQYGVSKENRPLPIVEMGLFMDRDGIPLAFCLNPGNTNEQQTMIPLEEKLGKNFNLSKFVVCTDAGLSSNTNRCYNDYEGDDGMRAFITTQSVKKLKKYLRDWALDPEGWLVLGADSKERHNIDMLGDDDDYERIYYKSRWIKETVSVILDGKPVKKELEQQLVVSYSPKYRNYLRRVRENQIERAINSIRCGAKAVEKKRQNDPKRLIKAIHTTNTGDAADKTFYCLNEKMIKAEEKYDGFYAVCTNLEDKPEEIVKVNDHRWKIEECFRIMKKEFEARPVFLQRSERILAHFITCFIALIMFRYLEKRLGDKYSSGKIIKTLKEMDFLKQEGEGYQPVYTRTEITDALHDAFGFCTSKKGIKMKEMRKICAQTKIPKKV